MSIRLRQLVLASVIASLRLLRLAATLLWWFIVLVINPIYVALKWLGRPLVIWVYTQYLKIAARLKRSAFMQNKVLFIFGNRYFIHVLVAMLSLFVTSTNILQAKEIERSDVFAKNSSLYKIVSPDDEIEEEIVEVGLIPQTSSTVSYVNKAGIEVATISNLDPTAEAPRTVGDQLAILGSGSAVVSTSVTQTNRGIRSGVTSYTIKDGDTIGQIADRFGVSTSTLLWANSLSSSSYIRPGNTLKIPPASGVLYQVADGDTLDKIITKYNGNLDETVRVNDIGADHLIAVGTEILIVDGTPPPPPQPTVTSYFASRSESSATSSYQPSNLPNYVTAGQFNYPVGCRGAMTTYWGHAGRGRDLPCPFGTPIYAATDGTATISFTGAWGSGYGNAIDINNGAGIMTRYAHMNAFAISSGQHVSRGQVIGYVGMTGRTSGPHLHFEIHINGVAYDPINYLR